MTRESGNPSVESMEKLPENPSEEDILALKEVKAYKSSVEKLMNQPASEQHIQNYKKIVKKFLNYV